MISSSQSSGYALPVALGFVGLLSLLSIAFAVHLRVESARVSGVLDHERARLAALYGLAEGLAAVRQATGRDTVVTAAYEPEGGEHPTGWTGVWDTADGTLLRILVSGAAVGAPACPTAENVIVARRGDGDAVAAYLVEGEAGAHHAWWVDDEGRKAALFARPPVAAGNGSNGGTLAQVLAPLAALPAAAVGSGEDAPPKLAEVQLLRSRLIDIPGLGHHWRWQAADIAALGAHFTVSSRGVLANTADGGLRRNLASLDGIDDDSSWTASLRQVLSGRVGEDGMLEPRGVAHDPGDEDAVPRLEDAPRPVVTEVGIYLWLARHPAPEQHRLKVHLSVRLNLWNPYAARLRGVAETGEPALFIAPGRLPPMVVEWSTGDGAHHGLFQLNPAALIWRPDSAQMTGDPVQLDRLPLSYSHLNPGEVRTFSIRLTGLLDEQVLDPTPHRYTDDDYSLRAAPGQFNFSLQLPDDSLVVDFRTLPFAAAGSSDYRPLQLRAVSMTGSPAYGDAALLWHWALREEVVWSDGQEGQDIPAPPPPPALRSGRFRFAAGDDLDQLARIYRLTPNPGAAPLDLQVFAGRPAIFYGGNGSLARNYLALYDYATTHPASLAYLLNFPLVDGEVTGSNTRHDVFDRFFFFPEDGDLSPGEQWLFNNRYSSGADDSDSDTTPLLLGAFNINSTSVEAWRAVLAARTIHDWSYRLLSTPSPAGDVANTVFRFPHSAGFSVAAPWELDAAYPDGEADTQAQWYRDSWAPQWMRAWASGIRLLSNAETEALASAIVARLRQRQPFLSLAEAASEPWLQEAIDRTAINALGDRPYLEADPEDRFPRHSPSFVSQEDVIALIAPFWAVRSDTFTIRAYGRVDGPHGRPAAEAWCEARVQRLPTGDEHGRPLEIEHFRWLYADEL